MTGGRSDAPLFMLQLQPDAARAGLWIAGEGLSRRGADDGYGWHALLKAAFGGAAPQPFRVIEYPRKPMQLLGYTRADAGALRDHAAAYADPAVGAALNIESLAVKRMPDAFRPGQRLGFEVRVRPTIRQRVGGDRNESRERDAFLAAIEKAGPRASRADLDRTAVYTNWLRDRFQAYRVELIEASSLAMRRTRISRRDAKRELQSGIEGPDATFSGTLEVGNPDDFQHLLARGVGRHRAFGFGMLLLRPLGER